MHAFLFRRTLNEMTHEHYNTLAHKMLSKEYSEVEQVSPLIKNRPPNQQNKICILVIFSNNHHNENQISTKSEKDPFMISIILECCL